MQMITGERKSLELKKHVGAIHSSHRLTLVQRKIANALLYNAYDHLLSREEHQVHIATLCKLIGYDSHDYKKIKSALVALISTVIEWNLVDKDKVDAEGIWNASAIISDASIGGSVCTYSYGQKMRKLLHHPELYGRLNMKVQARFKSTYGLALYENCIRYQDISQTPWFDLETFRKLMGVEEGKYRIFRDFKRRVLDKAVSEVNAYSPIYIDAQFKKMGRQVTALQFLIKKSHKCSKHSIANGKDMSIDQKLRNIYGFSNHQTEEVLSIYDASYVLEKMAIVESSSSFQSGKIINLSKYLQSALKQDYQAPKSSREYVASIQENKKRKNELEEANVEKRVKYRAYQNRFILDALANITENKKSELMKGFDRFIAMGVYYNVFLKSGLENPLVADRFCDYVRVHKTELLGGITAFEDYCKEN